jgi:hypothetical protein
VCHYANVSEGHEVPWSEIVRSKWNVDRTICRGFSDFFPVGEQLRKLMGLLENMAHVGRIQAAVAWWETNETATLAQVNAMIQAGADYQRTKLPPNYYGGNVSVSNYEPGTVISAESGRKVTPGPVAAVNGFEVVNKLVMNGIGFRFGLSASVWGSSEASFASALVEGTPMVLAIANRQKKVRGFTCAVATRVLEFCERTGRLPRGTARRVRPVATSAPVVIADEEKKARTFLALLDKNCASPQEYIREQGGDPKQVAADIKAWQAQFPQQQPGGVPGAPREDPAPGTGPAPTDPESTPPGSAGGDGSSPNDPAPDADQFGEACLREACLREAFTGTITDALGRKRHYVDGKQVAAPTEPTVAKTAPERPAAAPSSAPAGPPRAPRTRPDPPPERFARNENGNVKVDADVQRWCEGHNEPEVARHVGGKALPDNEPMDVILPPPPDAPAHGCELKTMVANAGRQIRMKPDAKARKRAWRRQNKVPVHTIVIDDTQVYNALGPGKHDLSKRRIFYRRGFGSFKVDRMHEVSGGMAGLKVLIETPTRQLPPGAWKPKPKAA